MTQMPNSPQVKIALVAVSRDCFPIELSRRRHRKLVQATLAIGIDVFACPVIIENEHDVAKALEACSQAGANAAAIYLGNFGPEGPLSIFAAEFPGPVMLCGAAEEDNAELLDNRGDAFCGMLSACYNLNLRDVHAHLPKQAVGLPSELAEEILHFESVARVIIGLKRLKIISFGPRPHDFFTCNAPLAPLYQLGVEVMENSELDLYSMYEETPEDDPELVPIAKDMAHELGSGNTYPELLPRLARLEVALERFAERNLGSRDFVVFANKCWPAFPRVFRFLPCFVNSRLASRGIPVACETDLYGGLSQYMCQLASDRSTVLLDINNTLPKTMITAEMDLHGTRTEDLFMGFHCGNTPSACMTECSLGFARTAYRVMENPVNPPDITRGTLEGRISPGGVTLFRLQGSPANELRSYVASGTILDLDPATFGGVGVLAIPNFFRFYRHVLLQQCFPHHGALAFSDCGGALFDALVMLGVDNISTPLPPQTLYPSENPFRMCSSLND